MLVIWSEHGTIRLWQKCVMQLTQTLTFFLYCKVFLFHPHMINDSLKQLQFLLIMSCNVWDYKVSLLPMSEKMNVYFHCDVFYAYSKVFTSNNISVLSDKKVPSHRFQTSSSSFISKVVLKFVLLCIQKTQNFSMKPNKCLT